MVSLKRSSVNTIIQCFSDVGYKPCICAYFKKGKKCCPISAVYMKNKGIFSDKTSLSKRRNILLDNFNINDFEQGFIVGYDNDSIEGLFYNNKKEIEQGFKKGLVVRQKLETLGLL